MKCYYERFRKNFTNEGALQNIKTAFLHYVDNNLLNLGVETIKSPFGMDIKWYDMERTICDMIKDKKHMDKEIYTSYAKRENKLYFFRGSANN